MLLTFAALSVIALVLTFITLWRYEAWWVRGWDFPRLQLGVLVLLLFVTEIALLDFSHLWPWVLVALSFVCGAYQTWWVIPYTRQYPCEVKTARQNNGDNTIAILASNVLTPNKNSSALLQHVQDYQPDILVTLETDRWWQDQLDPLLETYPYTLKCPLDNLYGMHVYSKLTTIYGQRAWILLY